MSLVYEILPEPSPSELDQSLEQALEHAFQNGVTAIHDMGSYGGWQDLDTYQRAHRAENCLYNPDQKFGSNPFEERDDFLEYLPKGYR